MIPNNGRTTFDLATTRPAYTVNSYGKKGASSYDADRKGKGDCPWLETYPVRSVCKCGFQLGRLGHLDHHRQFMEETV